jgi:hypothetical protein
LYSTTGDLLKWEQGLLGGKLLSPASVQKMTAPFKNDYAMGLLISTVAQRKVIVHSGGIDGFNAYMAYYPASRVTVAVLANVNGPAADELGVKLAAVAHGDTVRLTTERKEVPVSPTTLATYVGTYRVAPGAELLITLAGGQLMAQVGNQPKVPLFAESDTSFFLKTVDAQIDFVKNPSNVVTHLVLHQGGRDQRGTRTSDTVRERTEVNLPAAVLAKYAGAYQLAPNVDLVVTVEGTQLMAQPTGQPKVPLFAESDTSFFFKAVDAQIDFSVDSTGRVTGLTLHQGGRHLPADRK